jgi:hypothetical protein
VKNGERDARLKQRGWTIIIAIAELGKNRKDCERNNAKREQGIGHGRKKRSKEQTGA